MGKRLIITTEFSTYELDRDAMTVTRHTAGAALRRDDEAIPVVEMTLPRIGEPVVFALDLRGDDVTTIRTTSLVTAVEEIDLETA